ncbi:ATP-binding protein [Caulobacter sp. UNC279MFTsu5.1]|uniref:ATP-binding response regulator n=1 Tax=Caulobacter sp. UNC279MFTsu5.1 TaxID=1502775 RepID=UPI000380E5D9|nr:ATP-binding protein [Caulobacter sp. UNC279MFTsu5.1]SFJ29755.1 Signal transduction histidine kinase [Caulobacter sp. UNC279MFTsu5.1]
MVVRRRIGSAAALAALLVAAPAVAAPAPAPASPIDARLAAAKDAMMGDPGGALTLSAQALAMARADAGPHRDQEIAAAQWLQGEALLRLDRPDEAAPVIAAGLATAARKVPDTRLHGDLVMTQAALESARGQVQPALRDFQAAYRIFGKAGHPRGQAVALQNIGSIYQNAHDYQKVLHYYAQSAEAYPADPLLRLSAANNIGNALMADGRYGRAVAEFEQARGIARRMGKPQLEARIMANQAIAEAHEGRPGAASALIDSALALLRPLPDAQGARRSVMKAMVQVELARGRPEAAAQVLAPLFEGVDLETTGPDYVDLHAAAYKAYKQLDRPDLALAHLEAFKRLDDQGQALAASTNAALMGARFDHANQASRIAQLKAGQLQRDVQLAHARNLVVTVLLAGAGLMVAVLLAAIVGVRRGRNQARAAAQRLRETNQLLEKAAQARTAFLANTSHEMRTPLNGILGMTEVVLARPDLDLKLRDQLGVVSAGAETMRALVDDILDMARLETDGVTLVRTALDLPELGRAAVRLWSDKAAAKGLALTCDLSQAPGRIVEDGGRLRQILFALLSNAVKFTARGTVRLTLSTAPGPGGERLVLQVADTGTGVPPDKRVEVFEPFGQADSSRARAHGGAGLGLAICRRLADAMGGEIRLDSLVGQGTTVTVSLPLERADLAAPAPNSPALKDCGLLFCDANPLTRSVVAAVLRPQVRQLTTVGTGPDALEAARGQRFHLALVEAGSLGGDPGARRAGLDALRDALAPTPIAVLLGRDDGAPDLALETAQEADLRAAGAALVVRKPITAAKLAEALAGLFERPPPDDLVAARAVATA